VEEAQLFIHLIYDVIFQLTITREQYNKLCEEIWEKIFKKLNETFKKNNIKKTDIEEIILIGGSSRTPGIQAELKNQGFNDKVIVFKRNSEEFTSMGATLYGNEIVKENNNLK
jgi:molecular chaperone DnaK (HSP70)